jgi:hypothetical protein
VSRQKLDRCPWCDKHNRTASDWEQEGSRRATPDDDPADIHDDGVFGMRVRAYKPLCVRCANRRLDNPYNALLPMRRIGGVKHPGVCRDGCQTCADLLSAQDGP